MGLEPPDRGSDNLWSDIMENDNFKWYNIYPENDKLSIFETFTLPQLDAQYKFAKEIAKAGRNGIKLFIRKGTKAEENIKNMEELRIGSQSLKVVVKDDQTYNYAIGTIFAPELTKMTEDEIKSEIGAVVKTVNRLNQWNKDLNKAEPSHRYKLTFDSHYLPSSVKVAFLKFNVRRFYPLPRGCLACLSFDHVLKKCPEVKNGVARCRACGKNVGKDEQKSADEKKFVVNTHVCDPSPKCPNCNVNDDHKPNDRKCPAWILENNTIKIQFDQELSYFEAKRRAKSLNQVTETISFSGAVSGRPTVDFQRQSAVAKEWQAKIQALEALRDRIRAYKAQAAAIVAEIDDELENSDFVPTIEDHDLLESCRGATAQRKVTEMDVDSEIITLWDSPTASTHKLPRSDSAEKDEDNQPPIAKKTATLDPVDATKTRILKTLQSSGKIKVYDKITEKNLSRITLTKKEAMALLKNSPNEAEKFNNLFDITKAIFASEKGIYVVTSTF